MEPEHSRDKVAVVKYDGTPNSLARALELCDGLDGLKANDKVLLKPNIVWGGTKAMPPYGAVTTSTMVDYVLQILHDQGCTDITIGEGTVLNKELGSTTCRGFDWSGIGRVAKQYGAKLVDFNEGPFEAIQLEDVRVNVSKWASECDFLIDLPVLKAHRLTKISLGMKNLKGCLAPSSKKAFHRHDLNRLIALLNVRVPPSLTIIDGIYAMGPDLLGTASRMNVIIAGKDVFSCDIVGAEVMKIKPDEVECLRAFASLTGRHVSLDEIDLKGEPIDQVARTIEWRLRFEDVFRQAGISGITVQEAGHSCCSGCAVLLMALIAVLAKDCPGAALDHVQLRVGSDVTAKEESKTVILLGDCAISANRDRKDAVRIKGCPPPIQDTLMALVQKCLPPQRAAWIMMARAVKALGAKAGVYDEAFPAFGVFKSPEFERKHF